MKRECDCGLDFRTVSGSAEGMYSNVGTSFTHRYPSRRCQCHCHLVLPTSEAHCKVSSESTVRVPADCRQRYLPAIGKEVHRFIKNAFGRDC